MAIHQVHGVSAPHPELNLHANNSHRGNSTVLNEINKKTGVSGVWDRLTTGAKSGIVIGAIAGAGVLLAALLVCCIVQARKGKKEKAIADAQWEKEQAEFNEYRMQMMKGGFSQSVQPAPQYASYGHGQSGRF
jgi:tetrahydromethanopterin S-methyltransferase subunit F